MRVGVLGAGGVIAPAIVRDLGESVEVSSLHLLDLDGERAAVVAQAHGVGKASAAAVDATDPRAMAGALEDCDLLVNAASYRVNLAAMDAALAAGCHYVDLGGLYWMTGEQLELSEAFEAAGLLAVLGMGSSPGKTNVMAVRAVRELGAEPERVDVIAAGRDMDPPAGGPGFPYSPRTLVDELTMAPVAVRKGRAVELEPLLDGGEVLLSEPVGRTPTIFTLHSEVRTFPESFGCAACSFRLSLAPAVLERVRGLIGARDEEIDAAGRSASPPSAHTVSIHVVEAEAAGRVVTVTAITRPMEAWAIGGGIVSTAAPAAAAVRLLARGSVEARGALPPERCIEPDDLFAELERRNCSFEVRAAALR